MPQSVELPARICVCVKGASPPKIQATVVVFAQEEFDLPRDVGLIREHRALLHGASSHATWRFKISFGEVSSNGLPMSFAYGRWDANRNPADPTPYAPQHSQQSFLIHRLPEAVSTVHKTKRNLDWEPQL